MTWLEALFHGIIQGLGEFLPISSSGHLIIAPWLFGINKPGLSFSVALHLGTLLSLLIYFRKDWAKIIKGFFASLRLKPREYENEHKLAWLLLISAIPGAIAGLFLEDYIEEFLHQEEIVAFQLASFGILLWWIDHKCQQKRDFSSITLKDTILIGLAQTLALIPGTSRSGVTMTMARYLQIDRVSAAKFSFLMSTPIIAGAGILKIKDFIENNLNFSGFLGVFTSAVVGYFCIKYLLVLFKKYSFKSFAYYRLALAAVILIGIIEIQPSG